MTICSPCGKGGAQTAPSMLIVSSDILPQFKNCYPLIFLFYR
jgi:hypothetical protein